MKLKIQPEKNFRTLPIWSLKISIIIVLLGTLDQLDQINIYDHLNYNYIYYFNKRLPDLSVIVAYNINYWINYTIFYINDKAYYHFCYKKNIIKLIKMHQKIFRSQNKYFKARSIYLKYLKNDNFLTISLSQETYFYLIEIDLIYKQIEKLLPNQNAYNCINFNDGKKIINLYKEIQIKYEKLIKLLKTDLL